MWLFAVTAGLLTVFDFRPAATVSFPQVDKPARPLTASPRPLPVCSANTPIPRSALAAAGESRPHKGGFGLAGRRQQGRTRHSSGALSMVVTLVGPASRPISSAELSALGAQRRAGLLGVTITAYRQLYARTNNQLAGPVALHPCLADDHLARDGDDEDAAASSDSGSDEFRRELMSATLMRCVKSQ